MLGVFDIPKTVLALYFVLFSSFKKFRNIIPIYQIRIQTVKELDKGSKAHTWWSSKLNPGQPNPEPQSLNLTYCCLSSSFPDWKYRFCASLFFIYLAPVSVAEAAHVQQGINEMNPTESCELSMRNCYGLSVIFCVCWGCPNLRSTWFLKSPSGQGLAHGLPSPAKCCPISHSSLRSSMEVSKVVGIQEASFSCT